MEKHIIAIIGGAIAGSEAANQLAQKGIPSVVFEQNALPYGKLESGLPKWHYKLRDRQEAQIDQKLNHPLVRFLPEMRLGKNIHIRQLLDEWNFSAVLLAVGSWRDRPLSIDGINKYIGKGLLYMSRVTQWFNHCHDPKYNGEHYVLPYKNVVVIGGGLASLDIIKMVVIRQTLQRLQDLGISYDALRLERNGIPRSLQDLGLGWDELNLEAPKLFVRMALKELPLTTLPDNPTAEQLDKAAQTRKKIISKLQEKFPFDLVENQNLINKTTEGNQLTGLVFETIDRPKSEINIPTELLISAIGNIPEPLPGIPMDGEVYAIEDSVTGKIKGLKNTFALGNAVTGRGNIRQSMMHSKQVAEIIVDQYLSLAAEDYEKIFTERDTLAGQRVNSMLQTIRKQAELSQTQIKALNTLVKHYQKQVGYSGTYQEWIRRHLPVRIEDRVKI